MSELGLSEGDVFAALVGQRDDGLLEKRQRLVDVHRFRLRRALRLKQPQRLVDVHRFCLRRALRLKRHSFMTDGFPQKTLHFWCYAQHKNDKATYIIRNTQIDE